MPDGGGATPAELLRLGAARLAAAGTTSPAAEARTLLAHVTGRQLGLLLLSSSVTAAEAAEFLRLVDERASGVPVQHLTGVAHFRTVSLRVGSGVFVPRPETEVLVGWVLDAIADWPSPIVVDLCTGSGAIAKAIAAERPDARVHAVELSDDAMPYAQANLASTGVQLVQGDMAHAFAELNGQVDAVVSNPPYIPLEAWESVDPGVRDHDPALALWAGDDGLDALRVVAAVAMRLLRPGGVVAAEHAEVQVESAPAVFLEAGFDQVRDHPDLNRRPRFATATRPKPWH